MNDEQKRQEAIAAGERALYSLQAALKELGSAKNWGIMDMLGGGFISTAVKRSKMGHAQQYMDQAKKDLRSFSEELKGLHLESGLNVQTNDFLTFADYFFDGLIADWLVQDRIHQAADQVNEAVQKIEGLLRMLRK